MPDDSQNIPLKSKQSDMTATESDQEEYKPKLSMVEIIFITPLYLISDAFDIFIALFGLDDFGIISFTRTSISEFYFIVIKKMRKEIWLTNLVVGFITAIPYIGQFFPSTFGWMAIVIMDRVGAKKLEGVLQKTGVTGKVVEKIKK